MKQAVRLLILVIFTTLLLPAVSMAGSMADGLQCPSDWQRTKQMPPLLRYRTLLKRCVPQTNDAVIELYATSSASTSLVAELDKWTQDLRRNGMPYQRLLNEQPGHVSGYPAILRFFSGWDRDGKWYDSYLVVSNYRGTNYIFVGYAMKGHDRVRIQMRNSMNAWHYPGVSGPTNSGYSNTYNNNQQSLPDQNPTINSNTNPDTNVTVNVNRPGCTRQGSYNPPPAATNNNSYSNTQDTGYSNSGNTYQNKQDPKPANNKPDNSNNNDTQNNRPSDNKYLDYILN
ncbi:hypothetical protein [Maridesulfovibrio sp.]|uniref:hypothetical protein n=1 Tax=unclassified Maridesulfovibrio TaxID=2794999 RepID=UPI003AFFF3E0